MHTHLILTAVAATAVAQAFASPINDEGAPSIALPDSTIRTISLDEVEIITTVKENTRLRQQPSAVTIVSRQQLDDAGAGSLKGMSALVPNFFMPDYGSHLTSAIYIRGIGSRINTPAVGLYVDNVPYVDKSAFDFNFFDIERVDVLRGPQGTLYGRNAMGGIVRVFTKNPFTHQGVDVKLSYASGDNHRSASAVRYRRFSDKFALSYGTYYEGNDGFFKNTLTGSKVDGGESGGARLRGCLRPNERLTIDFSGSYDIIDEGAYPYFYTGSRTDSFNNNNVGSICNNRESTYRRHLANAGADVEYRADKWTLNSVTGYQFLDDRMFMDQDFLPQDIYTLEQLQRINTVSEEFTFKNTETDTRWHWLTGANIMYQALRTEAPVTFYEDGLSWLSSSINSLMPDIAKIPMLQRMGFTGMQVNFRGDELRMAGEYHTPTLNLALFHQSTFDVTEHLSLTAGLRLDYDRMQMRYDSPANVAYGFRMPNALNEKMAIDLQTLESRISYVGSQHNQHLSLLPKIAVKYDFDRRGNVYASVAMGERSGGYNLQMFNELLQGSLRVDMMDGIQDGVAAYLDRLSSAPGVSMPPSIPDPDAHGAMITISEYVRRMMGQSMPKFEVPKAEQVIYNPEYSWNYEVGTHLNLLDRRLQLDAAAFYIDTRNQQIARFAPSGFGRMMVNAGRSHSYGAEFTALWRPDAHLTLTGNYGYTRATFTDYDAGGDSDYTGNFVPFVPRHTVHFDAAYSWHFAHSFWAHSLTLGADYNGAGRIYWTEDNTASQSYYSLLGARISLQTKWANFTLWTKNLTNTRYNTFYFESVGRGFEQHGKPFRVGFDVKLSF